MNTGARGPLNARARRPCDTEGIDVSKKTPSLQDATRAPPLRALSPKWLTRWRDVQKQYCAAYNTRLSKTTEDCTTHSYNKRCGRARCCMYCTTLCFAIRTMLNCTSESWRCCAALQEASGGAMLQFWTVPCNIRLHKQFNAACTIRWAPRNPPREIYMTFWTMRCCEKSCSTVPYTVLYSP